MHPGAGLYLVDEGVNELRAGQRGEGPCQCQQTLLTEPLLAVAGAAAAFNTPNVKPMSKSEQAKRNKRIILTLPKT